MALIFTRRVTRRILCFLLFIVFSFSYASAQNPVVDENLLPGTPLDVWDPVSDNNPIEGFAQEFSVNKGQTIHFKIDVESATPQAYTVKIYRLGWYQGHGARFITNVGSGLSGSLQPLGNYDPVTGKTDCNNWAVSTQWDVPADAVSGVYAARLDCPTLNAKSLVLFVVRNDNGNTPVLFKTSDATWQAYNDYGGNSFYVAAIPVPGFTHATKLSYQRPLRLRGDKSNFFNAEYPMLRWLEKNGYDVSYTTDMDMARDASAITPSIHKTLLSVGHDEYWSKEQFDKWETARNNGVNLAFFSGNEVYWKTRWEDNFQTLVCYKEGTMGESVCNTKCDPLPNVWTGLWRDGCSPAYAANDGCRPEGSLTGQMSWTQSTGSIKVPDLYKNLRFWKNTSVATLGASQEVVLPYGTLGNEWDPEHFTQTYPAHRIVLSNTTQAGQVHKMSLYRHSGGAFVFGAGTMQWAWGLDERHDMNTATGSPLPASADMKQATVNLLFDMQAVPATLETGLVMPAVLNDIIAPNSTITFPTHTAAVPGSPITVTGTAVDNGGGAVAGVEISIDNGTTWQKATGLENWTYTFTPAGYGNITIKARAWDDFGNVEATGTAPSANAISISQTGPFSFSVFNSSYPQSEPMFFSGGGPVELGMKFRSTIPGLITGFRYYKVLGVTGEHIGHLWDNFGNLLGTATFTNETASGWQSVTLSTPVSINANTTYIVSYFAASGEFSRQDPFFTTTIENNFLRGLANGVDGGNGVYNYAAAPSFPTNTFGSSNYFADVIFESTDLVAPQVLNVTPTDNATDIQLNIQPTATFDEDLNPASVTRSTVTLTGPGNVMVPGTVSLIGGKVINFKPNNDLALNTTYTVTLKGGLIDPIIKDMIGNALAANYTWSFTTGGLAAPVVTTKPISQNVCANVPVSFTSAATGIPTPTVQWQVSETNGNTWTNIPGATAATYTFSAPASANSNQYRAVWTNNQGVDMSAPAILAVSPDLTATLGAVDNELCPGEPIQLVLAVASGQSPFNLVINGNMYSGVEVGQPFNPTLSNESIWMPSNTPGEFIHPDNGSIEVGVKFQANKDGVVKGIRFFKGGSANGGTHIGSLWSPTGVLLAQATFVNETASGWQEVLFASPVAVNAGITYVASYFLPMGNYSKNGGYFAASGHSNGNSLNALQSTALDGNGVYNYSGTPTFPDQTAGETNYWVDVVFAPYITSATTTFNLTSLTAANGCNVAGNPISTVTVTVSGEGNAGVITGAESACSGTMNQFESNGDIGGTWSSSNTAVAAVNAAGIVHAVSEGECDITYTITGCNGNVSATKHFVVLPNANAGVISGNSPLCIGANNTLFANGDAGGVWSSSNPLVAIVDQAGMVSAIAQGSTEISYTVSAGCNAPVSAAITVVVVRNADAGTISGAQSVCINGSVTLTSNGDANGMWISSNSSVASVDAATGIVTGVAVGSADITYTINNGCNSPVAAFVTLSVNGAADPGIVSGNSPLCIGAATTYSTNGVSGGTWSSSNPAIATVDASGNVMPLSAGETNIIYTVSGCTGEVSASAALTVNPNVIAGVINGSSPMCAGSDLMFSSDGNAGGVWSSSNPLIASVNAAGNVTALAAGTTTITYTINAGCGSPISATYLLTVNGAAVAGTVSGNSPLCVGAATTYSSNGTSGGTWSSSNLAVATVDASGNVMPLSAGETNIIYTVSGCTGEVSASAALSVNPNVFAGAISGSSPMCAGSDLMFSSDGNAGGVWSSSNPLIASVNAVGNVTALAAGTTTITYTINAGCGSPISATYLLTVNGAAVAGTVSGNSPLCIGAVATYTSNGTAGGTWASSNPAIASVNANGVVTALAAGSINITYTVSGCTGDISSLKILTVSPNVNAGTIRGSSPLCKGSSFLFSSNGSAGGVWSSSNPAVASVNAAGNVTGLSAGTTTITYTINAGCGGPSSATYLLTVSGSATAGTVSGTASLCIGAVATYTSNGTAGGTWASSNPSVASVAANGLVTATGAGTTNITYSVSGCAGIVTATRTLTVNPNANAGTVSGNSPMCIGETAAYTSNGNTGGVWSSSNTTVATVSATGVVTARAAGTANITYRISTGCNAPVSAFKTLTVTPKAVTGTVNGTSPLCIGANANYTFTGTAGGSWTSSNTAVATVNANGVVTAVAAGSSVIKYTVTSGCTTVSASKTITVSVNANAGTVSGTSPLCINASATYTSNGNTGGVWSSSNTAIATVTSTGVVKGLSAGTVTITYRVNTGCNSPVSASKTLTVNPNVSAGTISGTTPLCKGATATYTTNGTTGGTWSSSNTAIATVNASGIVTAQAAGSVTIKYTVSGCGGTFSATKALTVTNSGSAGTIAGASPLCIGVTTNYTTNGSTGGTWSSSNTAVASVSATGSVKALSAGTTIIKYTVNGCGGQVSATKTLTVNPNAKAGVVSGTLATCTLESTQFTTTGDTGGVWSSSNQLVAYVNETGLVFSLLPGTANITYTVNTGCNAPVSSFKTVTVTALTVAGEMSGNSPICKGATTPYSVNGGTGGVWTSSNTAVAKVSTTGLVTGVNAGTAVITYTIPGCTLYNTASKTIVVNPATTANAGTISGGSTLCSGSSSTYSSNGNSGGVWSSSNTSIATVNATTGVVRGYATGTVSIRYTVTPACGNAVTATKSIQVRNCFIAGNTSQGSSSMRVAPVLEIDAYPNPAYDEFTVRVMGTSNENTILTVTDVLGTVVYQAHGPVKSQYVFGKGFKPGVYMVQVVQGGLKQSTKLIKQ